MDAETKEILKWILLAFCILMLVSHLSWYITTAVTCPAQYPVPFRCFIGSILGFVFLVLYIPAGIFWWIVTYLFGGASHGFLTFLFAAATAALLASGNGAKLMDALVNLASFFVPANKADREAFGVDADVRMDRETMEKEAERDASRGTMEEAVREYEEAKARLDEFKKRD